MITWLQLKLLEYSFTEMAFSLFSAKQNSLEIFKKKFPKSACYEITQSVVMEFMKINKIMFEVTNESMILIQNWQYSLLYK